MKLGISNGLQVQEQCPHQQDLQYFFTVLTNIIEVWNLMDKKMAQVVIQALVLPRMDYSLLMGSAEYQIDKLHRIQNMCRRVTCGVRKFDSISYHLKDLHWLCMCEHMPYKICILMFKSYRDIAPKYLAELVSFKSRCSRNLCSNSRFMAYVPRSNNVLTSSSTFSILEHKLWNGLLVTLQVKMNIKDFKVALKTHLFKESHQ